MKKLCALCMFFALLLCACTQPKERTIEMPALTAANNMNLDVRSVELTDSNTVLKMKAYFRPGLWIRISDNSKIIADGKEYALQSADGITPGEEFYMPESGETEFSLTFPAIPLSTERIDFTEGISDGWKIWGIDISGEKHENSTYPASLPKSFVNTDLTKMNLKPELKAEESTITFKVLDYNPEFGNNLEVSLFDIAGYETLNIKLDEKGSAKLTKKIYGPTNLLISLTDLTDYSPWDLSVLPGENVDILLDPRSTVATQMNYRGEPFRPTTYAYDNGSLAPLNQNTELLNKYKMTIFDISSPVALWNSTPDEYADNLITLHDAMADSIKASTELPESIKELALAENDLNTLCGISNARNVLVNNFYYTHRDNPDANPLDSIKAFPGEEQFARVAKAVNLDNPYIIMSYSAADAFQTDWSKYVPSKQASELYAFGKIYETATKGQLTENQIEEAKKMSNPFFAEFAVDRNEETLKKMELAADLICELPDTDNDKLFEAIIEPYRGKVVLVDLWNTWCGPCRAALKANEPLKTGELSDEDIVWVYIADESSDYSKYLNMIPEIKGVHHMVSQDQINTIREQFQVDGIPFYILVDRNGKAVGHPDFRDHSKLIEGVKGAL